MPFRFRRARPAPVHAVLALIALLAAAPAAAEVTITNAWIRGTVPSQTATGAFMEVRSSEAVTLVGVTCPVAASADVHEMSMSGGVMRMRPAPRIDLSPGRTLSLQPGGYHVMLEGLKRPLEKGQSVSLSLIFEGPNRSRFTVQTTARVVGLGDSAPASMPMRMDEKK